jgi:hypothetical protein
MNCFIGYCIDCNEKLYDDDLYCPVCGSLLNKEIIEELEKPEDFYEIDNCERCSKYGECSCHDGICE